MSDSRSLRSTTDPVVDLSDDAIVMWGSSYFWVRAVEEPAFPQVQTAVLHGHVWNSAGEVWGPYGPKTYRARVHPPLYELDDETREECGFHARGSLDAWAARRSKASAASAQAADAEAARRVKARRKAVAALEENDVIRLGSVPVLVERVEESTPGGSYELVGREWSLEGGGHWGPSKIWDYDPETEPDPRLKALSDEEREHLGVPGRSAEDAKDWADRLVDFGPYTYEQYFVPRSTNYAGPLPRFPAPAEGPCRCPSCASEGWFAQSPLCKWWGAHCELCQGKRKWMDFAAREWRDCDLCRAQWRQDVGFFREALRSPRLAARRLREEAQRNRAAPSMGGLDAGAVAGGAPYQRGVAQLTRAAQETQRCAADFGRLTDGLEGNRWGTAVVSAIRAAADGLRDVDGLYRGLAEQMNQEGRNGAAAHDSVPYAPDPDGLGV